MSATIALPQPKPEAAPRRSLRSFLAIDQQARFQAFAQTLIFPYFFPVIFFPVIFVSRLF